MAASLPKAIASVVLFVVLLLLVTLERRSGARPPEPPPIRPPQRLLVGGGGDTTREGVLSAPRDFAFTEDDPLPHHKKAPGADQWWAAHAELRSTVVDWEEVQRALLRAARHTAKGAETTGTFVLVGGRPRVEQCAPLPATASLGAGGYLFKTTAAHGCDESLFLDLLTALGLAYSGRQAAFVSVKKAGAFVYAPSLALRQHLWSRGGGAQMARQKACATAERLLERHSRSPNQWSLEDFGRVCKEFGVDFAFTRTLAPQEKVLKTAPSAALAALSEFYQDAAAGAPAFRQATNKKKRRVYFVPGA